ncbi:hypothetical protein ACI65C_000468 [Semiaphis heraclei]
MDKTVALRNGSGILLLISALISAGVAIWQNRDQLIDLINNIFGRRNLTEQQALNEALLELQKERIEEEKNSKKK